MPPEITFLFGFATAFALMFIYRRGFSRGRKETGHVAATRETETRNDYQSQVDHLRQRLALLERIPTDPAPRTARDIDALRDTLGHAYGRDSRVTYGSISVGAVNPKKKKKTKPQ